jgi:hypothetical protein
VATAGVDAAGAVCAHPVKVENKTTIAVRISRFVGPPIPIQDFFLIYMDKTHALFGSFGVG